MTRYNEWVDRLEKLRYFLDRGADSARRALDQLDCASAEEMPVDYVARQVGLTEAAIKGAELELSHLIGSMTGWLGQWMTEAAAERKVRGAATVTPRPNCDQTPGN